MTPAEQIATLEPPAPAPSIGVPTANLALRVCRNAVAHLTGRNLISLGRLVVASTIARTYGKEVFGQYSVIIVMLSIAEWVLDFGTSDVFVREICRTPERGIRLLRILTALKGFQTAAASSGFVLLMAALRYSGDMMHAAMFAVGSLVFFSGVLIYHTLFKASLTIEREVTAEFVSVLLMIALVRAAAHYGHTVTLIFACHMASRGAFLGLCYLLGRTRFRLSTRETSWPDIRWAFHASAAIGFIGLLVVVYESMDVLLLSRFGSLSDVAYYSGAQRFISPVVIVLMAIGSTLYPVVASYWPDAFGDFEKSCRRATDIVFVLAGLVICALVSGADFLMRLLGPELAAGAAILRVLAVVLFVKAISNTLGPVLYVVQAQNLALWVVAGALIAKASLIVLLAPHFGYIGVASSAVATDSATAALTLVLLRHSAGVRIHWAIPLKVIAITAVAALAPRFVFVPASPFSPFAAMALFVLLAFLSRSVSLAEVRSLIARNKA